MGSTFVDYSNKKSGNGVFGGGETSSTIYLQFVPGITVSVVTSVDHDDYNNDNRIINTIVAKPHVSNKTVSNEHQNSSGNRYIPMFRGMVDVPAVGDPVLLCTIGNINYYLGPLNTENNPNFNNDYLFKTANAALGNLFGSSDGPSSKNFIKNGQVRLQKPNSILDAFIGSNGGLHPPPAVNETHGDMIFEGRHGNSIRIGSRTDKPYIYFSNGRTSASPVESLGDGSLISMTSFGALNQHFPQFKNRLEGDSDTIRSQRGFLYGSDIPVNQNERVRTMTSMIDLLETPPSSNTANTNFNPSYGWMSSQILITSGRVTINSDSSNVHISSNKNLYFGAGENLAISTNKDLLVESRNIFLGRKAYELFNESDDKKKRENPPEPLILGEKLANLLNDLIDILSTMHFLNPVGTPTPMFDGQMVPTADAPNPALKRKSFSDIKDAIESIKSYYHFIEPNNEINKEIEIAKEQ